MQVGDVIDITYTALSADRPVIAQLSRDFGLDVSILGAALETIRGHQAGRTRLAVPGDASVALKVIDRAIQVHGGGGVSDDFPLALWYAHMRTLRLADGPDEVHKMTIARREYRRRDPEWGRKK